MTKKTHNTKAGFSLVELVVLIIVASLAVTPIVMLLYNTLSYGTTVRAQTAATSLATGLMEEILSKSFEDPQGGAGSFGTEEGPRASYDDVDDYDGLNLTPPQDSQGNSLTDYSGFRTRVTVENVAAASPDGSAETDGSTNFKRATVTVSWNNDSKLVRLQGLASNFSPPGGFLSGLTLIERVDSNNDDLKFRVRNDSGDDFYVSHLTATWSTPAAYFTTISLNAEGHNNYGTVWDDDEHGDVRLGSGDTAMLNQGKRVRIPDGTTMTIHYSDFRSAKSGGSNQYVDGTTFQIDIWAPPYRFQSVTVPPES